jgi:hypothetical protein
MAAEKIPATSAAAPAAETAESASARMKRFDKDGDGMLDDAERAAAKEALKREPLEPQKSRAAGSLAGQDGFRQKMVGIASGAFGQELGGLARLNSAPLAC